MGNACFMHWIQKHYVPPLKFFSINKKMWYTTALSIKISGQYQEPHNFLWWCWHEKQIRIRYGICLPSKLIGEGSWGISHQNSEKFMASVHKFSSLVAPNSWLVRPNQSWIYTLYIYYACQSASWVRGLVWNPTMSDFQDTVPDLWQLFMLYFWNLLLKSESQVI
jgi:hypothetical protein